MFKSFLLLFLYGVFLDPVTSFAQENLIRNGSFEELTKCPDGSYGFPAKNWFVLQGTPDLFAACAPRSSSLAVPTNFNGTRSTFAGYNYAGIFLVFVAKSCNETICYLASESISTHLTKALEAGKRYKISFMLSLADSAVFRTDSLFCSFSTEAPVAAKTIARPLQPLPASKWAQSVAYYYLDDVQLTEE